MQYLKYSITTLSPILLSRTVGDRNMVRSMNYIPGSTVLGVLANKYLNKGGALSDFYNLFFNGNVQFINAYPAVKLNDIDTEMRSYPIPFSIQTLKDNNDKIIDMLYSESNEQTLPINTYEGIFGIIKDNMIYKYELRKTINFHHERNDSTGTSETGKIFNYESINPDNIFEGYILGTKEELEQIRNVDIDNSIIYIGRSKNSQYGKAEFKFSDEEPRKFKTEIPDVEPDINDGMISITFLSDIILYNELGNSTADINCLEGFLKSRISENIKINKSFIRQGIIENYVNVWNMKKPSEVCFLAGSCFTLSGINSTDFDKIKELEISGIGQRKNEGFGRVVFGLQKPDVLKWYNTLETEYDENIAIPELTQKIISTSIKEYLLKYISTKAYQDEKTFINQNKGKKELTKSLVGRLESFIANSPDKSTFTDKISKLRKDARDKLKDYVIEYNKKIGFNEFLESFDLDINKDVLNNTDTKNAKELGEKIKYDFNTLKDILYKEYLLTFFRALRKSLKKEVN